MSGMTWLQAVRKVLEEAAGPLHYAEIAKRAIERGYKNNSATPDYTVSAVLTEDIKKGQSAQFVRLGQGMYALKGHEAESAQQVALSDDSPAITEAPAPLAIAVRSYGIFWERSRVDWGAGNPKLLGKQYEAAKEVDHSKQRGVYLLYDSRELVYVGRSIELGLGSRLKEHTTNRLRSRWDRFSWFGLCPVSDSGEVDWQVPGKADVGQVIALLEAVLIEALEPRLNRQQGQGLIGAEFLQVEDPDLVEKRKKLMIAELLAK